MLKPNEIHIRLAMLIDTIDQADDVDDAIHAAVQDIVYPVRIDGVPDWEWNRAVEEEVWDSSNSVPASTSYGRGSW